MFIVADLVSLIGGKVKFIWSNAGADPGFLERGFICVKMCVCVCGGGGSQLQVLSHFS